MRRRLTVTTVLALLVALLAATVGYYVLLSSSLERDADAALLARAEAAVATVDLRGGTVVIAESAGDATLDATVWVLGPGGAVVLAPQSTSVAPADVTVLAGVSVPTFANVAPQTRLLATPIPGASPRQATVVVSLSLAPYERSERIGLVSAIGLDVAIIVVLAIVTRWLIGAALRPVDAMTRQARDWLAHDVDRRFEVAEPTEDEIGRLGSTLNDLLARLGASIRHERRLTDEIAHELRTPLARARAEAEVSAGSRDVRVLRSALEAIVVDIDELSAAADTLLRAARAPATDGARSVVANGIRQAAGSVHPPAPIVIEIEQDPGTAVDGLTVACEESLVTRMLVPQLENTARHAVRLVQVRWFLVGDQVLIDVVDDGPGLGADETERVFAPGERGRAADGTAGFGLGLSLSRRLARSCGGDVAALPGPGGHFTTSLPVG